MTVLACVVVVAGSALGQSGPVLLFSFEEGSGTTAIDGSGHGNTGAFTGTTWGDGIQGGALVFDGNDRVTMQPTPSLTALTYPTSISLWFKTTATPGKSLLIANKGAYLTSGATYFGIGFANPAMSPDAHVDHAVFVKLSDGANTLSYCGSHPVTDAQWHHLAVVFRSRGANPEIYLDGVRDLPVLVTRHWGWGTPARFVDADLTYLGANDTDLDYFIGTMDELAIFPWGLTEAEITQLAQVPSPPGGSITVRAVIDGQAAAAPWAFSFGIRTFTLPGAGGEKVFSNLAPGTYTITETMPPLGYTCSSESSGGETGSSTITVTLDPGEDLIVTFANRDVQGSQVLQFNFEEGTGATAFDSSGYGNNAAITGTTWGSGISGGGLVFDGNDRVTIASSASLEALTFPTSISMWFKTVAAPGGAMLIANEGAFNTSGEIYFGIAFARPSWPEAHVDHALAIKLSDSRNTIFYCGSQPVTDQGWHHVAVVIRTQGQPPEIYLDGQRDPNVRATWDWGAGTPTRFMDADPCYLGDNNIGSHYFTGTLDEVKVYPRGLSQLEISQLAEIPAGPPPDAPSNLAATPVSTTEIDLAWSDNSDNETGFRIERRIDGGDYDEIDTVGAGVVTYSDTGLSESTTYCYRVCAYSGGGNSGYAEDCAETPETPPAVPDLRIVRVEPVQVLFGDSNDDGKLDVNYDNDGYFDFVLGKPWAVLVFLECNTRKELVDALQKDNTKWIRVTVGTKGSDQSLGSQEFLGEALLTALNDNHVFVEGGHPKWRFYIAVTLGDATLQLDGQHVTTRIDAGGLSLDGTPGGTTIFEYTSPIETVSTRGLRLRFYSIIGPGDDAPISPGETAQQGAAFIQGCFPIAPDDLVVGGPVQSESLKASRWPWEIGLIDDINRLSVLARDEGYDIGCGIVGDTYFVSRLEKQNTAGRGWGLFGRMLAGLVVRDKQAVTVAHEIGHVLGLYVHHEDYSLFPPEVGGDKVGEVSGFGYWVEELELQVKHPTWFGEARPYKEKLITFMGQADSLDRTWTDNTVDASHDRRDYSAIMERLSPSGGRAVQPAPRVGDGLAIYLAVAVQPTGELDLLSWRRALAGVDAPQASGGWTASFVDSTGNPLGVWSFDPSPVFDGPEAEIPLVYCGAIPVPVAAVAVQFRLADGTLISPTPSPWRSAASQDAGLVFIVPKLLADAVFNLPDDAFVGDSGQAIDALFAALQVLDDALARGLWHGARQSLDAFRVLFCQLTVPGFVPACAYSYSASEFDSLASDMSRMLGVGPSPGGSTGGGSSTSAPVASAGLDQTVSVGERVYLDGSRSYDPDAGQPAIARETQTSQGCVCGHPEHAKLLFRWAFSARYYAGGEAVLAIPDGSLAAATLQGGDAECASFVPDKPGDYLLTLTVTDSDGATTDQVRVMVVVPHTESQWFAEGWNLLSLPLVPVESKASASLGPTARGASLYSFSQGYERVSTLEPVGGYWMYLQEAQTLTVRGRHVTADVTATFDKAGWHLVGAPFPIRWRDVTVLVDGVQVPLGDVSSARLVLTEVFAYSQSEGVYYTSDLLLPWQGYWVLTKVDSVTILFRAQDAIPESSMADLREPRGSEVPPPPPAFLAPADLEARVYPVPVGADGVVHFLVEGVSEIEAISVRVFDLAGTLLWDAEAPDIYLDWPVTGNTGLPLASGPYIYRIDVNTNGRWILLKRGVLFVRD